MVQALKTGDIDYARGVPVEQFNALKDQPDIKTVAGKRNGWVELGFNGYGTGTGKTIKGGGASTKALQDPAFRDALGYAIDKQALVDKVRGGYGDAGSTNVPPVLQDARRTRRSPGTRTRRTRGPSTSPSRSRSSTPPAMCSTRTASASTRKASRSISTW